MEIEHWLLKLLESSNTDLHAVLKYYGVDNSRLSRDLVASIDRQTAKFLWQVDSQPFGYKFDYLIGVHDDLVYLGGRESVAAFSISAQGRLEWEQSFGGEKSFGRGMVTPDGVYIPLENSVVQFDLKGDMGRGKILNRVGVDFGTKAPVGNLYSDGQRLWVVGANRLYALGPAPEETTEQDGDDASRDDSDDADSGTSDG